MNDFILDPNHYYLLAFSGGVDSSVLFHVLVSNGYKFRVVHFNHHTRGLENDLDLKHVVELCDKFNIKYDICDYTHESGNFQSQARNYRLSTYKELVKKHDLTGVLLAHHGDDQIENIMMLDDKIGSVLMSEKRMIDGLLVFRPLLNIYKSQIYEYAKNNMVEYREDSSNTDEKYLRNYHRSKNQYSIVEKNVIIQLQKERELYYQKVSNELTSSISKKFYNEFNDSYLLLYLFCKKYVEQNISINLLKMIINNIDFHGHKSFSLPGGFQLVQSYDVLYIKKHESIPNINEKKLVIGVNEFNGIEFENSIDIGKIRTRKANDRIKLSIGSKKVTRAMIDMKIDRLEREKWPVVVDEDDNVLYIPKRIKK
jgi:tRNA(Ile)-lysidine synthetase-like protein